METLEEWATFGGPGFRPRTATHAEELRAGQPWLRCGVDSEVARLRSVLLSWPAETLEFEGDPDEQLMLERVDLQEIRRETENIAEFFRAREVEVHVHRPSRPPPPNLIFMRDLVFMTPEGAILARMASQQRAGEERFAAEALASIGVPILASLRADAVFEGADALWLDARTVVLGVGCRTNRTAVEQLSSLLASMGVTTHLVTVPKVAQHLLGLVNPISDELAALYLAGDVRELQELLASRGIRCIQLAATHEVAQLRAMNFVALEPGHIVMPSNCPQTREEFERHGVRCEELDVREYIKAGGALGCLTSVLHRAA
jgi:N-dimethylarginine dimethylaminohydrolase